MFPGEYRFPGAGRDIPGGIRIKIRIRIKILGGVRGLIMARTSFVVRGIVKTASHIIRGVFGGGRFLIALFGGFGFGLGLRALHSFRA